MHIDLYHLWDCPSSSRVRDFVERNRMRSYVRYVDVEDEFHAEAELERLSGSTEIPTLIFNGRPIRGGDAIIGWLQHYFLGDRPTPTLG